MQVIQVEGLGTTPARVNRFTGQIEVNKKIWNKLSDDYKRFILLHEEGHYVLNTDDEFEADRYAFERFAGTEKRSLKNSIKAMTEVFTQMNAEQKERINEQIKRALLYDYQVNNNKEALINYIEMDKTLLAANAAAMANKPLINQTLASSKEKTEPEPKKEEKFLGMPKTIGLIVAVIAAIVLIFIIIKI